MISLHVVQIRGWGLSIVQDYRGHQDLDPQRSKLLLMPQN